MKLALPASVRGEVEPHLPPGVSVGWYPGAPETSEAMAEAEVAWINILDADGQARAVEAGRKLKWVATIQAGVDTWPLARMKQRGLLFTNGAGVAAPPIAEFVVMGMLALIKNLRGLMAMQEERRWAPHGLGGFDLAGAKALIVGYGSIGAEIGRRLKAFDVEVTGVRRRPTGEPGVIGPDDWKARLGEFDWVILAAASTAETRGMIGPDELEAMKPGARIVNVARGFMIDQPALIGALTDGRLAGALLDVAEPEPPPGDDPIWTAPNVLLTGHSSAVGTGFYRRAAALFLDNLDRY
ncbi:MAG TPA: D-2-hydroxyacid dehydrogenase, partial [Caulobacteraceae bacterium]